MNVKRWTLIARYALFIALCMSLAYWAMQLFKPPLRTVVAPQPVAKADINLDAAAGLFGGHAALGASSDFQLEGVILAGDARDSIAILAVAGKPAQAIPTNAEVIPGVTVKEVHAQFVLLSQGGVAKRVELPDSTGVQVRARASSNAPVAVRASPPMPASEPVNPVQPQGLSAPHSIGSSGTSEPAAPPTQAAQVPQPQPPQAPQPQQPLQTSQPQQPSQTPQPQPTQTPPSQPPQQ